MAAVQIAPVAAAPGSPPPVRLSLFPGRPISSPHWWRRFRARTGGAGARGEGGAPAPLSALAAAITTFAARALASRRLAFALIASRSSPRWPHTSYRQALVNEFNTLDSNAQAGSSRAERCALAAAALVVDRGPGSSLHRGSGRDAAAPGAGADTVCFARARRRRCPCPRSHRPDGAATARVEDADAARAFDSIRPWPRFLRLFPGSIPQSPCRSAECSDKASEMALNDIRVFGRAKPHAPRRIHDVCHGQMAVTHSGGTIWSDSCILPAHGRCRSATAGKSGSLCRAASATEGTSLLGAHVGVTAKHELVEPRPIGRHAFQHGSQGHADM